MYSERVKKINAVGFPIYHTSSVKPQSNKCMPNYLWHTPTVVSCYSTRSEWSLASNI